MHAIACSKIGFRVSPETFTIVAFAAETFPASGYINVVNYMTKRWLPYIYGGVTQSQDD